jgi:formaldehyde-activating enzyme involved in methanogenesis
VAAGLITATQDLIVFVSVWIDKQASDETAVRHAAREAVGKAVTMCVNGRAPEAAASLVAGRDSLRNPFYGGD